MLSKWDNLKEWAERKLRKLIGRVLAVEGEDGHNRLCRFNTWVCHYGPHGTFEYVSHINLKAGGHLCLIGTCCGEPTESHMRQMDEQLMWFHATEKVLRESGALQTFVWENSRFSASTLCNCGQPDNPRLPEHQPLCPYRVEHDFQPSIEEYREALASVN
jgi:hypothetical protein